MKNAKKFIPALALAFALAVPAVASGHVEISPAKAPAGKPVDLEMHVGHGCDGAPTTRLVVQIPAGVSNAEAKPTKGWKASSTPSTLTWTGGPLPDHAEQAFPLTATLSGKKGQELLFKTIQKCEGGAETAWIEPAGGASESEHPSPVVTLASTATVPATDSQSEDDQVAQGDAAATGEPTATAANPEDDSEDDGGSGKSLLLIIVVGLAIGTVAGIIVRARRERK